MSVISIKCFMSFPFLFSFTVIHYFIAYDMNVNPKTEKIYTKYNFLYEYESYTEPSSFTESDLRY